MNLLVSLLIFTSEGLASSLLCPTAREFAMGGAGFALARGPEAVYLNPASLSSPNRDLLFSLGYGRLYLDIEHTSLFLTRPIGFLHAGLGLVNFDYGELTFKPEYPTDDENATFNANDLSLIAGLAAAVSPKGSVGLSFKYIKEYLYVYSAGARAINFAINYEPDANNRVAIGVLDVGNSLKLKAEPFGLPMRIGLGYSNSIKRFRGGLDFGYLIRSKDWMAGLGEEFTLSRVFKIRAGARYFDGLSVTAGFGIAWSWLALDYGVARQPKDLGFSHYFGLKRNLP
jgi:hypothetical protein